MGAPKGSKNGRGVKGRSGRKSRYQEMQDANFLWDVFRNEYTTEEIKRKLKSGKFSIKDVWISKLVGGNERLLGELIRKLFPDKSILDASVNGKFESDKTLESLANGIQTIAKSITDRHTGTKEASKRTVQAK